MFWSIAVSPVFDFGALRCSFLQVKKMFPPYRLRNRLLPGYFVLLEDFGKGIALLKMYVCFVTVHFISTTINPGLLFLSVCLQVTHIELLRRDCGTGSLPPGQGPLPVLSLKAMIIGLDTLHNSTV